MKVEGNREQEGKPIQPVFNCNIYSCLDDLYFNFSKYLLQLRIKRGLTNTASTLRIAGTLSSGGCDWRMKILIQLH